MISRIFSGTGSAGETGREGDVWAGKSEKDLEPTYDPSSSLGKVETC